MKRRIPMLIVSITGILMTIQYFIPHPWSEAMYNNALDWLVIIGIFAMPLGIYSMIRIQVLKIQRRSRGWGYAVISLISLFAMLGLGYTQECLESGTFFMKIFEFIYIPIQATMFSLLAFYIASAAYRAFRARNILATIVLAGAIIVMLGRIPIGEAISPFLPDLAAWIMTVPNMAAQRAIMIGLGLGAASTAMKIVLGIERSYMGME
ncbi:hypothetical protein JXA80_04830 [bacterium]|nr:hypothetical protein [candidate division CSSED10-310 bacterium]